MPYEGETAGHHALKSLSDSGAGTAFARQADLGGRRPIPRPAFRAFGTVAPRPVLMALDGSEAYGTMEHPSLPQGPGDDLYPPEAGLVSVAIVRIDAGGLAALPGAPESGAADPVALRRTERAMHLQVALPGRNTGGAGGLSDRDFFRSRVQETLETGGFGGETLADTLHALLLERRKIRCPNLECAAKPLTPQGGRLRSACPRCGKGILLSDALRAQYAFTDKPSCSTAIFKTREALEILCFMNLLRSLSMTDEGRKDLCRTAFVLDGRAALDDTHADLLPGVLREIRRIEDELEGGRLLIVSGVKSGRFVDHFENVDGAAKRLSRIPPGTAFLPDDAYITTHVEPRSGGQAWGENTYFGRPLIVKTRSGRRLVLNVAQPEADPPLTNAPDPVALGEAIALAEAHGIGRDEFLPLRRAHAHAAIPFRAGKTVIRRLLGGSSGQGGHARGAQAMMKAA